MSMPTAKRRHTDHSDDCNHQVCGYRFVQAFEKMRTILKNCYACMKAWYQHCLVDMSSIMQSSVQHASTSHAESERLLMMISNDDAAKELLAADGSFAAS